MSDSPSEDEASTGEWAQPFIGSLGEPGVRGPFTRNDFPSKVGGLPCWLDPSGLPSVDTDGLVCAECRVRMTFLLQIYAPRGEVSQESFHRTLMVFVCRRVKCSAAQKGTSVRVIRGQLPRENDFYGYNFDDEPPDCSSEVQATCSVCGLAAPHRCGTCKAVFYSSAECQAIDWKLGHKKVCAGATQVPDEALIKALEAKRARFRIPEREILIRPANEELPDLPKTRIEVTKPTFQDAKPDELPEDLFKAPSDPFFLEFQSAIECDPDQILRYGASKPLWAHEKGHPGETVSEVPLCSNCHSPREFEMQIMPQLLYLMGQRGGEEKMYDEFTPSGMGTSACWATVAIYTCSEFCTQKAPHPKWGSYIEEYAWVQTESYEL